MSDVVHVNNIISVKKRDCLVEWILQNKDSGYFQWSGHPGCIRRTTRFSTESVRYPDVAFSIQKKIKSIFNITSDFYPPFPWGMVASFGTEDDECKNHVDPTWYDNHSTFHCVVLLKKPIDGAIPVINGKEYIMEEMDGLYYPVSHLGHHTTKLIGKEPRIIWIFGFSIPNNT